MRKFYKKFGFVIIAVVALVSSAYIYPQIKDYLAAPKFTKINYTHTEHVQASFCITGPLACPYSKLYWYEAKGTQKDLAQDIIDKFSTEGYTLESDGVLCYGGAGDRYLFNKGQQIISVSFLAKVSLPGGNTSEVGCKRPPAEYSIEVDLPE
jgi:hypothetical protein